MLPAGSAKKLRETGVPCDVKGRAKHLWSIHQKMKKTGRDLDQIYDAIGFRVITTGAPAMVALVTALDTIDGP